MNPEILRILNDHFDALIALRASLVKAMETAGPARLAIELAVSSMDVELARFADVVWPYLLETQGAPRGAPVLRVVR